MAVTTPSLENLTTTRERQVWGEVMNERHEWEPEWRDLAKYILPRRYSWLTSSSGLGSGGGAESRSRSNSDRARGRYILDGTATRAARTCAAGMMNGITSPARPWVNLRIEGADENDSEISTYLDEVRRVIMRIMAESNFYNALAVFYLDLVVFGTATCLIYEDDDEVIRCYNSPLGEFALVQDSSLRVSGMAREFEMTVKQVGDRWGVENLSPSSRIAYEAKNAQMYRKIWICHLLEPNHADSGVARAFKFVETYWERGAADGKFLGKSGYYTKPLMAARWEVTGTDVYGTGPGHDALSDTIQLQHETKRKAQGIDKQVNPPLKADIALAHRPIANTPGGITFVAPGQSGGIDAAYTVNINLNDLKMDIMEVQARIRETFYNDLFKMISQLDTVRSATEVDARQEEKLVLLGPVLERVENEALDVAIRRIYAIAERFGLLPERPEGLEPGMIEIEYVSILADAQRAVATIGIERFLSIVGNVVAIWPEVKELPDIEMLMREYARAMGITGKGLRTVEQFAQRLMEMKQQQEGMAAMQQGGMLAEGAKTLSETDVGGGVNALQMALGG